MAAGGRGSALRVAARNGGQLRVVAVPPPTDDPHEVSGRAMLCFRGDDEEPHFDKHCSAPCSD